MTEHVQKTPTQLQDLDATPKPASKTPQLSSMRYQENQRKEYASKLYPIADEDLPTILRCHSSSLDESSDDSSLLHFGFTCIIPEGIRDGDGLEERALRLCMWVEKQIEEINENLQKEFPLLPPKLTRAFTVTADPHPSNMVTLKLYSNDKDIVEQKKTVLEGIREILSKTFKDVEGPMWHWDEERHGARAHNYQPFEEAFYPNGHPQRAERSIPSLEQ